MFGRHWEPAEGVIVDKRVNGSIGGGADAVATHSFVVDVTPLTGAAFRAEVQQLNTGDFWAPRIGQAVRLEVNPKNRKVRFDKDDPGLSFKEYQKGRSSSFEATLARPAGTPAFDVPSGGWANSGGTFPPGATFAPGSFAQAGTPAAGQPGVFPQTVFMNASDLPDVVKQALRQAAEQAAAQATANQPPAAPPLDPL